MIIGPNDMESWSQILGEKVETPEEFYNCLHADRKAHEMPPYCVSLIRTSCILGLLLVAVFYEKGRAIRYLECSAKEFYYADEVRKEILNKEDSTGKLYQAYQEELALRRRPAYTFPSLNLTFRVSDGSDEYRRPESWHENAQPISEHQFYGLLALLQQGDKFGRWIDLDWEDWGK